MKAWTLFCRSFNGEPFNGESAGWRVGLRGIGQRSGLEQGN